MFLSNIVNYVGDQAVRTLYGGGPSVNTGVSRFMTLIGRSFVGLVFQQGKPVLDSELNAASAILRKNLGGVMAEVIGSGFVAKGPVMAPSGATAFDFAMSSLIVAGQQPLKVAYNALPGDPIGKNRVGMNAKPGVGTRNDLVYLEMWFEEVEPANSTQTQSKDILVEGGSDSGTVTNDLYDAQALQETTRAIQLRWKIRVKDDVNFALYPKGMTDPAVFARGSNAAASAQVFQELGVTGFFVSGTGLQAEAQHFGAIEGYTYAVPLFNVTRTSAEAAINTGGIVDLRPSIKILQDIEDLQNAPPPVPGVDPTNQAKINRYELSGGYPGIQNAGVTVFEHVFSQTVSFADDWAGSVSAARAASTGPVLLNIYRNGIFVGAITYSAGNTVGTYNPNVGPIVFNSGDVIRIDVGATDATLANVVWTLVGSL